MPRLDPVPVSLDPGLVARTLRLRPDAETSAGELLDVALPLLRPRAFFRDVCVDSRGEDTVEIESRLFRSRVLSRNLEKTDIVFPFLLTVGGDLEETASRQGDLLRQYYLETIADMALGAAAEFVEAHIRKTFGLKKLGTMSPGSLEDWPIGEQKPLFDLLGEETARIGVRLSDSLLMLPRKSVSGIFFSAEQSFTSCRLCPRAKCQGRRAAFEPEMREAYGLEKKG